MKIFISHPRRCLLNKLSVLVFAFFPLQASQAASSHRLIQAGYNFGSFMANGFHSSMQRYLPSWQSKRFSANESSGRVALKSFLNSFPNHTAFLAQWVRAGRSGHVASVEKLLYPSNEYGDRSNLRIFFN